MNDVNHTQENGYDFGVEIPRRHRHGGTVRNPNSMAGIIRDMPNGGSKFFPSRKVSDLTSIANILRRRGHISFKIVCRSVVENGVKGVRVWRIDAE
jgi:hypothetical protein